MTGPATLAADRSNVYGGTVHHPHDADTIYCLLWDPLIQTFALTGVRLRGLQGPELRDPGGREVAAAVAGLASPGRPVEVTDVGPYPRPGHITGRLTVAGVDIGGWLLERGYAVPWDGRGPKPVVPWPPVIPANAEGGDGV